MLQNKFVRENGDIIGSASIVSCEYTASVNSTTNLTVGDCTAAQVEVELRTPSEMITKGEKLQYIQVEDGLENIIGIFYAEAPTVATKNSIKFTAYDGIAKLATDFSEWLNNNQDMFPMSLREQAIYACEIAGVSFSEDSFPNEELTIPSYYAQGVTCRQIIAWAAQLAGKFVSCKPTGEIFFDWYRSTSTTVAKTDVLMDSLSRKDYATDKIMRVQFKQSANDIGVIYPADSDGNVLSISSNSLAALLDGNTLASVAKTLYEQLSSITYTPVTFRVKRTAAITPGDIITVVDGSGNSVYTYVMKVYTGSSGTTITSTGDKNYADKAAVSSEKYENIPGKMLTLEKNIDGLKIANRDTEGKVASIKLDVDGVKSEVSNTAADLEAVRENVSKIEQDAQSVAIRVQKIEDDGVDKLTSSFGLTVNESQVDIDRDGAFVHNTLNENGMYVRQKSDGSAILKADSDGVEAQDITVRKYFSISGYFRREVIEDDGEMCEACFWTGGLES